MNGGWSSWCKSQYCFTGLELNLVLLTIYVFDAGTCTGGGLRAFRESYSFFCTPLWVLLFLVAPKQPLFLTVSRSTPITHSHTQAVS